LCEKLVYIYLRNKCTKEWRKDRKKEVNHPKKIFFEQAVLFLKSEGTFFSAIAILKILKFFKFNENVAMLVYY